MMRFLAVDFYDRQSIQTFYYYYSLTPEEVELSAKGCLDEKTMLEKEYKITTGDVTLTKFEKLIIEKIKKDKKDIYEYDTIERVLLYAEELTKIQKECQEILDMFEENNYGFAEEVFNRIAPHVSNLMYIPHLVSLGDLNPKNLIFQYEVDFRNMRSFMYYILAKIYNSKDRLVKCAFCGKYVYAPTPHQIGNLKKGNQIVHDFCRHDYNLKKDRERKRKKKKEKLGGA